MPSLKEVAQIIRDDNDVIINNQDKQTESLDGINKNFDRFFTLQERDKLDRFERRKEEDRKRPRGVGAARTGAMAGIAAGAGLLFNPAALLKAMLNPKILLGIVGVLAIKPAFAALKLAAQGLTNVLDDYAKTQRGLNRFAAKELETKEKAAARAAQVEVERLKAEEKLARIQQRAAQNELVEARKVEKRQEKIQADADARAKANAQSIIAERRHAEAIQKGEEIRQQKISADNARATALRNAELAREIKGMRGGFLRGGLDMQTDAVRALSASIDATPRAAGLGTMSGPEAPGLGMPVDTGSAIKPMGLGEVSTSVETPSQRATRLLMANLEDMKAAGFEPVKMQNGGIRFVEAGKPGVFVSAENVLDLTNRQKAMAQADRSGALGRNAAKATLRAGAKGLAIADAAMIALTAGDVAVKEAQAAGEDLTASALASRYPAEALALPGYLGDLGVMLGNIVSSKLTGEKLMEQTTMGRDLSNFLVEMATRADEAMGIGQNVVSGSVQQKLVATADKFYEEASGAIDYLTGKDKENELAVEEVMRQYNGYFNTPQPGFQISAPTVDQSITNVSNNGYAISGPSGAGDQSHLRSRIGND